VRKTTVAQQEIRAVLYLRLSDLRDIDLDNDGVGKTFADRETKLREFAAILKWPVAKVIVENDLNPDRNGRQRGASAFKRRVITLADGTKVRRVWRPGFREILDMFRDGRANAVITEDLDRTFRDPRDLEDFIDVAEEFRVNARSLAGSLTFTDGGTDGEITMARFLVAVANKSSRDTSRRVGDARERKAKAGEFGGGPRPFGFEPDGITVRQAEADIIDECSRRVLEIDTRWDGTKREGQLQGLRMLAAELRERDVPTVTGAKWSAENLRDILLRPRNAGIMVLRGEEIGAAPWDPLVSVDRFRAVVSLLTDPDRATAPGAPARWLGTGLYGCGVCCDGTSVQVCIGDRSPRYRCKDYAHLTRNAETLDKLTRKMIIARLSAPDAVDLIPSAVPSVDLAALRAEAASIRQNLDEMAEDRALGLITRAQMLTATTVGQQRLNAINAELSANLLTSPLTPLVGAADVAAVWDRQPLAAKRAVLEALFTVTILPVGRGKRVFNPESIVYEPKLPAAA
jgi:site-specific DNA recombinase